MASRVVMKSPTDAQASGPLLAVGVLCLTVGMAVASGSSNASLVGSTTLERQELTPGVRPRRSTYKFK
jgi:hypothetical protein